MTLEQLQTLATIVNSIGLPATIGVLAIMAAWYLLPVLADYLRARIRTEKAHAAILESDGSEVHK